MSNFDHSWRMEKSQSIIVQVCFILEQTNSQKENGSQYNSQNDLRGVLHEATKLFCEAVEEKHGDSDRWSPELVDYLFLHPSKCEATLNIVAGANYRDGYYDAS